MSKTIAIVAALIVIAVGALLLAGGRDETAAPAGESGGIVAETPAPTENRWIVIQGHKIPSEPLTVPVGTTVVFENRDDFTGLPYENHTITTGTVDSSGESGVQGVVPNSGSGNPDGLIEIALDTNETSSFTFAEPGNYFFYIAEHPNVSGQGQINVVAVEEKVADDEVVAMEARSFSFSPDTLDAEVGEKMTIDVSATGQHTFTIDEFDVNVIVPHGKTTRVEFVPTRSGTFEYYCAIPGHREAGQVGSIVVEG